MPNNCSNALSLSLGQLSPRQQRIFILSRLHGASYQEIADQLAGFPSTVQKELKLIMAICMGVAERLKANEPDRRQNGDARAFATPVFALIKQCAKLPRNTVTDMPPSARHLPARPIRVPWTRPWTG
nr:sigma factor-like helix-turn-helix DNA-binding protein [Pseudomonas peli]